MRMDPFYYYLVARTKYYDQVVSDAVAKGVQSIVSVGCGSDTRPYRFMQLLKSNGVRVLECDRPEVIRVKQRIAKRWQGLDHVDYLPIDLNDGVWPDVTCWIDERPDRKTLVLMEGVSPYVDDVPFKQFLLLWASSSRPAVSWPTISRFAESETISDAQDELKTPFASQARGAKSRPFMKRTAFDSSAWSSVSTCAPDCCLVWPGRRLHCFPRTPSSSSARIHQGKT